MIYDVGRLYAPHKSVPSVAHPLISPVYAEPEHLKVHKKSNTSSFMCCHHVVCYVVLCCVVLCYVYVDVRVLCGVALCDVV